ncbi:MAG: Zn-ribbon domain-containing OB-fold protein [Alphaproteobacteria bacterium]|nr:Zn-ribbon domain-containing OB-fold protein [Alphaproteobacteria bacterium]
MTEMNRKDYPAPEINPETETFWNATAEGKLLLKRCKACDKVHYYPRAICPHCLSDDTEWVAASGRGRIYSYTVLRKAPVPYALAYVTLEEGVTMMTNIVDCAFDDIAVDKPVSVVFGDTGAGPALPLFTLA